MNTEKRKQQNPIEFEDDLLEGVVGGAKYVAAMHSQRSKNIESTILAVVSQ